jgi:ABC-type multidrug transport system fused ATPase/permease subunit
LVTEKVIDVNTTQYNYKCIEKCDNKTHVEVFNRCYKVDKSKSNSTSDADFESDAVGFFEIAVEGLSSAWPGMIGACLVAFVFSYLLLILFRHAAKYVIWIITIGNLVLLFGVAIVFFVFGAIWPGVMFVITGLLNVLLIFIFRKRIALVAKLFKETSKVLMDVPAIMFEPILVKRNLNLLTTTFMLFKFFILDFSRTHSFCCAFYLLFHCYSSFRISKGTQESRQTWHARCVCA